MNHHLRKKARLTSFLRKALKPLFAICALAPVFGLHHASAQNLFWQPPGGGNGFCNASIPANQNWGTTAAAENTAWVQGDTATFAGTAAGMVTLNNADTMFVTGMMFTTTGYIITDDGSGAALQLDNGTSATAVTITVNTGITATITTALTSGFGGDTLLINGGGTLILNGFNAGTYLGTSITIDGGTTVQAGVNVAQGTGIFAIPGQVPIILGDGGGAGTLDLNGLSQSIASLAGGSNGTVTNANAANPYATLTVGQSAVNNTVFAGVLTDTATTIANANGNATPNGGLGLTVVAPAAAGYTLQLTGLNNYHGATIIGGALGNNTATLQGGAVNSFSANSIVTVNASGVLDLNGLNQTVAALQGGASTGNITNTKANTPAILTLNGDGGTDTQVTNASIVDGAGTIGLTKSVGGYTQVLAGNDTYSGATTVTAGTLANGSTTGFSSASAFSVTSGAFLDLNGFNATLASVTGNGIITNDSGNVTSPTIGNATLITGNTTSTFSGIMEDGSSGTLALTKVGGGTFILAGTSSYSVLTTVNNGTLANGSATGFSSHSAYTVAAPGILDLNGFSVSIASLAGNGTVTNGSGNVPVPIPGNATLTMGSNNTSTTFSGNVVDGMSGTLGLTKLGTGAMTLSGANTYSGGTILQNGALIVASSSALGKGNVTVTGGALQSGGSNTTINVGGNYSQTGGELDLRIGGTTAGSFDRLAVAGSASLAGRLSITSVNGFAPKNGESIAVVTANGGVSGQFSPLSGNLANFPMVKLTVAYLPNEVLLDFSQASFVQMATRFHLELTPNEKAVARALDDLTRGPEATRLLSVLDSLPITTLPAAYDLIAPTEYGAIYEISRGEAKMTAATVENRLDEIHATAAPAGAAGPSGPYDGKGSKEVAPPSESRLGFFANGSGEFVGIGNSSNAAGFNFDSGAVTAGVDYRFTDHFVAGVLFTYTRTRADLDLSGRLDANAFSGGLYASLFGGGAYVNAYVGAGYNDYEANRAGLGSFVNGSTNGSDFTALIASGYDAHAGGFTYGPVASFQYTYTGLDAFNETGSVDPLHVNAGYGQSFLSNVGMRATYDWHIGSMVLVPEVRATWQHEYGDTFDEISASMLLGSPNFTVTSSPIGRDSLVVNAGFTLRITPDVSAYAFYDGELARSNYQANNVMAGFHVSF